MISSNSLDGQTHSLIMSLFGGGEVVNDSIHEMKKGRERAKDRALGSRRKGRAGRQGMNTQDGDGAGEQRSVHFHGSSRLET